MITGEAATGHRADPPSPEERGQRPASGKLVHRLHPGHHTPDDWDHARVRGGRMRHRVISQC